MLKKKLTLADLEYPSEFVARHIGPSIDDYSEMLRSLGTHALSQLTAQVVPKAITMKETLNILDGCTEAQALEELRDIANQNKVFRNFIGQGYYDTLTPSVIQRNILESPSWYTAYTPYQPEISQGRLEALINFQTMISDLTGMDISNSSMLDEGTFEEMDTRVYSLDPLEFNATSSYPEKLKQNQAKTKETDTVISGMGEMGGMPMSIAVMDFRFMAASLGSAAGEKITRAIERGVEKSCPVIIVSASGGARMQEGILSLMQLAKTSAALAKLSEAGLPYFSILTNPTMAGVMASYASLGDVIIAEPEALIGFAGPRVIKETTQQDLPEGFQTSEFLLDRGLVDIIVPRLEIRDRMINLMKALYGAKK